MSVARRLLRDYTPTPTPSEHVPTRRAAALARFTDVLEHPLETVS